MEDIYKGCTGRKKSKKSPIGNGVRQGDTMTPKLFTACLEGVFRKLEWEKSGIRVNGEYLSHLRFADIILFSESEQLQRMLRSCTQKAV